MSVHSYIAIRSLRIYWLFTALIGIMILIKLVLVLVNGGNTHTDLRAYTAAAEHLRAGEPLYWLPIDQNGIPPNYLYPPFLAIIFMLLGPHQVAWWIWAGISLAAWVGSIALILYVLNEPIHRRLGAPGWPMLLAGLLVFPPVMHHMIWGQVGLPIVFCLSGAWWALRSNRDSLAGLCIGIAIAFKVYPVLVCLPLLVGGRWRTLVTAALSSLILIGGGFVVVGWEQTHFYLTQVLPAASDHGIGNVGNYALRERLGSPLFELIAVFLLAWIAYIAWRGKLLEAYLLAVTAILLVTPVVWGHYFVLALLPLLNALARANRLQFVILVLAFTAMSTVSLVFRVPAVLIPLAQVMPTLGVVLLGGVQLAQALRQPDEVVEAYHVSPKPDTAI